MLYGVSPPYFNVVLDSMTVVMSLFPDKPTYENLLSSIGKSVPILYYMDEINYCLYLLC